MMSPLDDYQLERYIHKFRLNDIPTEPNARWEYCTEKILEGYNRLRYNAILLRFLVILLIPRILIFPPIILILLSEEGIRVFNFNEFPISHKKDLFNLCGKVKNMKNKPDEFVYSITSRKIKSIGADLIASGFISKDVAAEYNKLSFKLSQHQDYEKLLKWERKWAQFKNDRLIPDLPKN